MKFNLNHLGWYQIVGGVIGLISLLPVLSSLASNKFYVVVLLLAIVFWSYSIYAGYCCIKTKSNAFRLSLINQILQVVGFAVIGYGLTYISGVYLSVGLDLFESIEMSFGIGMSKLDLSFNQDHEVAFVKVNLIALLCIYLIEKMRGADSERGAE